jgi:hypothetical protein
VCSHCYGLPLYSFHRFKKGPISNSGLSKRRLFNSFQLISIYWFSVDSISKSWFFNLFFLNLKSIKSLTTINLFQDSDLNFQMIQPDFWSLIYSIRFPRFIKISFRFIKSWVSNLGPQIDSIDGLLFKFSRFLIPNFCFWTRSKFLISI